MVERALLPHLTKPFAFFGHCLGALIAFELSRQIRTLHGLQPVALFVSGHRAPQLPDRFPPSHRLPDAQFAVELRRRNGTREEVLQNPQVMRLVLPLLRADFAICETYLYTPGEVLDCPLTVFGGQADPAVLPQELDGWAEQTQGPCRVQILPGDHFFLQTARIQLLAGLSQDLNQMISPNGTN
jgi:medium-chain acyl-[acyl-carrier-protein] hydrolase